MRIVHIQASMPSAGNAAYRLSTAMRDRGIDSIVLNLYPSANKENAYMIGLKNFRLSKVVDKIVKRFRKAGIKKNAYFYNSLPVWGVNIVNNKYVKAADVIYIHWVAGCLTIRNLEQVAQLGKPIFVFMHDMWMFTGGCHHSLGCKKYVKDCKGCHMFNIDNLSVCNQLCKKTDLYSAYSNMYFISPSKWMTEMAQESASMKTKKVYNIPNVVDENIFKPLDRNEVRNILNLPLNKTIITFGCQAGQKNPFKGWTYLEKAINMVNRDEILIVIYGSDYDKETADRVKYPIHFMGKIVDEKVLAQICNAADLFVTPSLCENYSLTILENLLCGTPVVGFDTTGIPEMVQTGKTGYLAKYKDAEDLAHGIEYLISNHIQVNIRDYYSAQKIVEQHVQLINSIKDKEENVKL